MMEAALGTGQMSNVAAPRDLLGAVTVQLIIPAVSRFNLLD